jgi:hypothetical protein
MPYIATILITLLLMIPASQSSCFDTEVRPRTAARWNTSFEAGEQNSPNAVTKEKAAEIAADFVTTFYHVQVGALETQEFRTKPVPFWLVSFSSVPNRSTESAIC